ncbi:MAG: nickel-dependent hydrogenase large subunit [Candidatus Aminicenantes bacterium]|nr:nickel-dependent hydrogenase large subunit [Candidatus Aminicenantes bacterium]
MKKTISIDHLARIEGNGSLIATIDGQVVTEVKFLINEGPRLIERLAVGKTPEEDVSLAPRICAICTLSHKNAVIRAMENALEIKVPPKITLLRELMHLGEFIESHSLHLYYLALPDYVGFPNAIAMASRFPFEVKIALEMKQFGNHIMKVLSGRFIHGENPVIGGFGRYPTKEELMFIKARAIQFMPFVHKTTELFCSLPYPDIPEEETIFACCEPGNGQYGLWGDEILVSTGEKIYRDDYPKLTNEFLVPHSTAKRSRYQGRTYTVGAQARINLLGERLKGEAEKMFRRFYNDRWKRNPLFQNPAQAIEIMYCFERIPEVIDEIFKYPQDPGIVSYTIKNGKGTGLVEAPRGLLIHHYEIKDGRITYADIITPTAQNADEIERYCLLAAQKLLEQGKEELIKDRLELIVRAFDPCVSCSAHLVEVRKIEENDWPKKLEQIRATNPIIIGLGSLGHGDDEAGLLVVTHLKRNGYVEAYWEEEVIDDETFWTKAEDHPIIFVDVLNFGAEAGKVTLIPLNHLLWNTSLTHRLMPTLLAWLTPEMIKKSYFLGIQPASLKANHLSSPVFEAIKKIVNGLKK